MRDVPLPDSDFQRALCSKSRRGAPTSKQAPAWLLGVMFRHRARLAAAKRVDAQRYAAALDDASRQRRTRSAAAAADALVAAGRARTAAGTDGQPRPSHTVAAAGPGPYLVTDPILGSRLTAAATYPPPRRPAPAVKYETARERKRREILAELAARAAARAVATS